jgi:hypothetical protein
MMLLSRDLHILFLCFFIDIYYATIIKPKLESNPEYLRLKSQIIDHPKTIEQLERRAGANKKKGLEADPEIYQRLRAEEQHKIMHVVIVVFFMTVIDNPTLSAEINYNCHTTC